jgi:hypothetical protein
MGLAVEEIDALGNVRVVVIALDLPGQTGKAGDLLGRT